MTSINHFPRGLIKHSFPCFNLAPVIFRSFCAIQKSNFHTIDTVHPIRAREKKNAACILRRGWPLPENTLFMNWHLNINTSLRSTTLLHPHTPLHSQPGIHETIHVLIKFIPAYIHIIDKIPYSIYYMPYSSTMSIKTVPITLRYQQKN